MQQVTIKDIQEFLDEMIKKNKKSLKRQFRTLQRAKVKVCSKIQNKKLQFIQKLKELGRDHLLKPILLTQDHQIVK